MLHTHPQFHFFVLGKQHCNETIKMAAIQFVLHAFVLVGAMETVQAMMIDTHLLMPQYKHFNTRCVSNYYFLSNLF